jgi:hypothetical protein
MLAYGLKIIMGCVYGYVFLYYYGGSDPWVLHANGIKEKQMLLNAPLQFFTEFGPATAMRKGSGFVEIAALYLVDLEYCLQAKTLGLFNLISNGNYYVNVVFWNFLIFWGHYWLFCLLTKQFPSKRQLYFILVFLFPPAIFWLSGIRSDGMIFLSISLMLLHFHHWLIKRRLVSLLLWVVGVTGVLIFRPPFAALLIPALISWWLVARFSRRPLPTFLAVYSFAGLIFFGSLLLPSDGFPGIVVRRQQEFIQLKGTTFELDTLRPSIGSFAKVLPQAFTNTFLRPYPWEVKGLLQAMAGVETVLFWLIVLSVFINTDPGWKTNIKQPFLFAFIFFGFSLYLFIGYTIPFPGAIVRYKIIPEILLLTAIASCMRSRLSKSN